MKKIEDYLLIGVLVCIGIPIALVVLPAAGFLVLIGFVVSVPFLIYEFLKKRHREKQLEWEIQEEREKANRELWDSRIKRWRSDL